MIFFMLLCAYFQLRKEFTMDFINFVLAFLYALYITSTPSMVSTDNYINEPPTTSASVVDDSVLPIGVARFIDVGNIDVNHLSEDDFSRVFFSYSLDSVIETPEYTQLYFSSINELVTLQFPAEQITKNSQDVNIPIASSLTQDFKNLYVLFTDKDCTDYYLAVLDQTDSNFLDYLM